MSGGKKISDHAFFGGSGSPRFPVGNKTKMESSAGGAGHESAYEDTTEAIKRVQDAGDSKAKSHKLKEGFRH